MRSALLLAALLALLALPSAAALSFSVSTGTSRYAINDTINITLSSDTDMNGTNITILLVNASNTSALFNRGLVAMNSTVNNGTNVTTTLAANVTKSGEYALVANFTFNSTNYTSSVTTKISRASTFVLSTNKASYAPAERINFTVKATDARGVGVASEAITVKLAYESNGTLVTNTSGTTNSAGEYASELTAPSNTDRYRLVVNDWLALKVFDVSAFEVVAFTGDSDASVKHRFGGNETVYVFVDLFSTGNRTRYTNSEYVSINITYPNGTSVSSTQTYSGSRINTTVVSALRGTYRVRVKPASLNANTDLTFIVQDFELRGSLEHATRGTTSTFFPSEEAVLVAAAYNVTSGEKLTLNLTNGSIWNLTVLNSRLEPLSTPSNTTNQTTAGYRFSFSVPAAPGLYYLQVSLNDTTTILDFAVRNASAEANPVDQEYKFKNVFVGNKQTIRIMALLSNATGNVNVTNVTLLEVRHVTGKDVTSGLTVTTNVTNVSGRAVGLVQFAAPQDAGWYFARVQVNGLYAAEARFLVKLYTVCAQLDGYKWFIGANDTASLTTKVSEAKDIGVVEGASGNVSASNASSSFGTVYGVFDCYGQYNTAVSGSSSAGNATANIRVAVSKVTNMQTSEDVTSKLSSLPSNTTDSSGKTSLVIPKPTNGWDSGEYLAELTLTDANNNTDKGFGRFAVRNFWVSIWPKQYSGYWKWFFGPTENFTFDVSSYNSTGTWYSYSQGGGAGDFCTVEKVFYHGDGAQWFWPPREVSSSTYTWTCTNQTNPANGRFNLTIVPSSAFKSGNYGVRLKINTTAGAKDTGDGWFAVKAYNTFLRSATSNYYDSWYKTPTETLNFTLDIANANATQFSCYWTACPASALTNDLINVTVKKILKYERWSPQDYAPSKYQAQVVNATAIANFSLNVTNGTANISLTPKAGAANTTWEAGSYSLVIEVSGPQGTDTATLWYEVRSFFADLQPWSTTTNRTVASFQTGQNITINATTASKPIWASTYGLNVTRYNTTITAAKLTYYDYLQNYRMVEVPVNFTPSQVNGTAIITVSTNTTLTVDRWYNLDLTFRDADGNEQAGSTSFQVKDFTFSVEKKNWQWEYTPSERIQLVARACGVDQYWCSSSTNYSGSPLNITVTNVFRSETWPYTPISGWSANTGRINSSNSSADINITQGSALSSGSYSAELTARYADGTGSAQRQSVWFQIRAFSFQANPSKWEFTASENITLNVSSDTAINITDVRLSCGYWPDQKAFVLGTNLTANSTTISVGTNFIKLSPSGTRWANGYCWGTLTASDGTNSETKTVSFTIKAFTLSTVAPNYYINSTQNYTITLTTDATRYLNISNLSLSVWDWGSIPLTLNTNYSLNATTIVGNGTVKFIPTGGAWPSYGSYSGSMTLVDMNDSSAQQSVWFSFYVPEPLSVSGYTSDSTGNWRAVNTSSSGRSVLYRATANKYNFTLGYFVPSPNVTIELLRIERETCVGNTTCSYSEISGVNVTGNTTTNANGVGYVNFTKSSDWAYGQHRLVFRANDTNTSTVNLNARTWMWVNS